MGNPNRTRNNKKMDNNQNEKSDCPGDTPECSVDTHPPQPEIDANRSVEPTLSDNTYPNCGHEKAGFLKHTVDIMRYTVKIKPLQEGSEKYFIEFIYDAHVDGRITFYFFEIGRESDSNVFPTAKKLDETTITVEKGLRTKLIYKKKLFDFPLHKRGLTEVYHLEIKTQATSSNSKHGSTDCVSQSTLAVFEKVNDESQVRVTNQLVWVNGVKYVCHDFVGFSYSMGIDRKDLGNVCLLCKSNEYPGIHRPIGNISLTNEEIGQGSNGTLVVEGTYDGRKVAVKRIPIKVRDVDNEIQNLERSNHPNIVQLRGKVDDGRFVYIALEKCECNLNDLILWCEKSNEFKAKLADFKNLKLWKDNTKDNPYPSEQLLKILRETVAGLAHLHERKIIHRNLNPQHVLINRETVAGPAHLHELETIHQNFSITAKVAGMGHSISDNKSSLTKSTTGIGSSEWQAPEVLKNGIQTLAMDLFSFGILLFFCITRGRHPFGDKVHESVKNIKGNCKKNLYLVNHLPEAYDLINQLTYPSPDYRPKTTQVRSHPFFWDPETRLSFLKASSDIVELTNKSEDYDSNLNESLLINKAYDKWDEQLDGELVKDIRTQTGISLGLRGLLRAIRNKYNHQVEFNIDLKKLVGWDPTGFDAYFRGKFPRLLMDVHKVMKKYRVKGPFFRKYYEECRF